MICASPAPDVVSLVKLTMHRDDLSDRNARTPARLPALWARMGDFDRAEALARSISEENRRAEAIGELVEVMVKAGLTDRVDRLVAEVRHEYRRIHLRNRLVSAVAGTGDFVRARSLAEGFANSDWRAQALISIAAAERPKDAELLLTAAVEIGDRTARHQAIHSVARSLIEAGFAESAIRFSSELIPEYLPGLVEQAARTLMRSGKASEAHRLVGKLDEEPARNLRIGMDLEAAARTDPESAFAGLTEIEESRRGGILLNLFEIVLEDDNVDFAEFALGGVGPYYGKLGLHLVLKHLGAKGAVERVEALLHHSAPDTESEIGLAARAEALTAMAEGTLQAGDLEQTRALAGRAEAIARRVGGSYRYGGALRSFIKLVTTTKNLAAAERLAGVLLVSDVAHYNIEQVARFLAELGDVKIAESLAFRLGAPAKVMKTLTPLLRRLRSGENSSEVFRIVQRVDDLPGGWIDDLDKRCAVEFFCAAGIPDRALEQADAVMSNHGRTWAQSRVIEELCTMGRTDDAVGIVQRVSGDEKTDELVEALAKALGAAGCDNGLEILSGLGVKRGRVALGFLEEFAAHDGERALQLAATSLEGFEQETALLAIAGRVDGPFRSRVLAQYMQRGEWARVVPLLNPIEQSALAEVVDQFVALQEARLGLGPETPDQPESVTPDGGCALCAQATTFE